MLQAEVKADTAQLYIDLMKKCLTRYIFGEKLENISTRLSEPGSGRVFMRKLYRAVNRELSKRAIVVAREFHFEPGLREEGRDWPPDAETMVGLKRLTNIESCVKSVLKENIPGDFVETGVWRGGSSIFMRAMLKAYGVTDRKVFVCDSFEGLPKPDVANFPKDKGDWLWEADVLKIGIDVVKGNFSKYGLLDEQVVFLKGWFKDTLPKAPIEKLAILRLDGDMYQSTIEALDNLYPKLSVGGVLLGR